MAATTALDANDLNVSHARVAGWRSGCNGLLRELKRVPVASLALSTDEILYVPRMHLRGVAVGRLADAAFETLWEMTAAAARDPPPGASEGLPCRFTSRTRYLAWLVGLWLGGVAQRAAAISATGTASLRDWQRRDLLSNGPVLISVTGPLVRAGLVIEWIARFEPLDFDLAETSLARTFGIHLQDAAARVAVPEPTKPEARKSTRRLGEGQTALSSASARESVARVEIAELCRELDQTAHDWRRLPLRGRRLLLAILQLARTPASASRHIDGSALAAAAAAAAAAAGVWANEPPVAVLPSGPSAPAKSRTIPRVQASAAEVRRKTATASIHNGAVSSAQAVSFQPDAETKSVDRQLSVRGDAAEATRPLPQMDEVETANVDSTLSFQSDFAGLLFLLNAFVALGLYSDFTGRSRSRLSASPLWLIDRIGLFWFSSKYRHDPLHRWIAVNSCGGQLPRDWMVEPGWCEPWGGRKGALLVEDAGRKTLWHPAGFPLADVADSRRRALSRIGRRDRRWRGRMPRLPIGRRGRWVACFAYFLDSRIRLAAGDRSLGLAALALPGQVIVDVLDVSANFSLDRHPVQLRLAGLDRNPAWQPAEGRSFRFHFS